MFTDIYSPRLEVPKDIPALPSMPPTQKQTTHPTETQAQQNAAAPETQGSSIPGASVSAIVPLTEFNKPKEPFFTFPKIDPYFQMLGITVLLLLFTVIVGTLVWRKSKNKKK